MENRHVKVQGSRRTGTPLRFKVLPPAYSGLANAPTLSFVTETLRGSEAITRVDSIFAFRASLKDQ